VCLEPDCTTKKHQRHCPLFPQLLAELLWRFLCRCVGNPSSVVKLVTPAYCHPVARRVKVVQHSPVLCPQWHSDCSGEWWLLLAPPIVNTRLAGLHAPSSTYPGTLCHVW
jgi:hypothetical protein